MLLFFSPEKNLIIFNYLHFQYYIYIYIYRVRSVNCKWLIFRMCSISFCFRLLSSKLESVGHCKKSSTMTQFSSSESLEMACCTDWHSSKKLQYEDFTASGCRSEDRFIFILMKTKHPADIMLFGVVTSDVDVMPLFIYPRGLRLNTETNIMCLEEVVLTWICWVGAGRSYVWKQVSALGHTSRKTQCLL